jgi:hypothetical protein
MRQQLRWLMALALSFYGTHASLAWAQPSSRLLEMSEQLDKLEKQDFSAALEQANACIRARSFDCSDRELAKAEKAVNGAKDKAALLVARNGLASERQLVADERRRAEETRLASIRREEETRAAEKRRAEEARLASIRREEEMQAAEERRAVARARAAEEAAYVANNSSSGTNVGAAILQGLNSSLSDYSRIQGIHNQTVANVQNLIAERQRREQEQRDRDRAQQERQRQAQREQQQQAADHQTRARQEQFRVAQVEVDVARERQERARREQENARREEEARREAAARAEEARARELRIAQERQDRIVKQEAEKVAKAKSESDFLAEVKRQFKLVARTCPGGEGRYFALGVNPNIKPEIVACYGIQFRAICRGGGISAYGSTSHFRSVANSCFAGEAVPIEPKLNCKPEDIQITVTEVTPC